MTRKKLVQHIGMSLTPWWLVFPYVANYLGLDAFPALACLLIFVALALFGLGLVWWAGRKWAA